MSTKCKPLASVCNATDSVTATPVPKSPPFDMCIGGNSLSWDRNALYLKYGTVIPDGEYTQFTMRNGCLVGAGFAALPTYTPPPCVENPAPCGDGGAGIGVSPEAGNLTTTTTSGIYTQIYTQAGSGVTITGTGLAGDPLVISASSGSGQTFMSTTADVDISTPAAGVVGIGLKPSGLAAGTYNGIQFNSRGIAVGYTPDTSSGITGVVGVGAVEASETGGVVTVGLKATPAGGNTFSLGGHTIALDAGGVVNTITPVVNVPAGSYTMGAYTVSISSTGEITSIVRTITLVAGTFTTADGKTVSYDMFGTIIQVA